MNFIRKLKYTEYRSPNYFQNERGENVEGDLVTTQLTSQDGKCFGQMSAFIADYTNPLRTELIAEMYKAVEISIQTKPELYCRCKQNIKAEEELSNEFRSQNIV